MPTKTVNQTRQNSPVSTESELQPKFKNSNNKIVQAMLAARREHLERYSRFLTNEEINRELKR